MAVKIKPKTTIMGIKRITEDTVKLTSHYQNIEAIDMSRVEYFSICSQVADPDPMVCSYEVTLGMHSGSQHGFHNLTAKEVLEKFGVDVEKLK